MSRQSRIHTAALVALGLTCELFPAPHRLGDVRLLVMGRLHLWPHWPALNAKQRVRVTDFLGQRPEALAEQKLLEQTLKAVLREAEDFEFAEESSGAAAGIGFWKREFRQVPGRPLEQRLEDWLGSLRSGRGAVATALVDVGGAEAVSLETASGLSFRVPTAHLPAGPAPQTLKPAEPVSEVRVDDARLEALAKRIDLAGLPLSYERTVVDRFMPRLRGVGGGARPATLDAGATSLLIAPTGSGKSVFSRLYALDLARQGVPVALVTPDVASVWTETLRLEQAAKAAELDVSVVPLSSWRNTADHLTDHLSRSAPEDPQGLRMLGRLGYTCLLSAYSTTEPPEYGQEPCKQLRQRFEGAKRERAVDCPFAGTCGRFSAFQSALSADVIVVNHHAFLAGRVPFPVQDEQGRARNTTVLEIVLSRAAVLLVDEVDALQSVAVGQVTRGLSLSSRGGASLFYQLAAEVDGRRGPAGLKLRSFERARSALLRIANEAERLTELVDRAELSWPREGVTWREGYDPWLAIRLFGERADRFDLLRRLYDAEPILENEGWEALRRVLYPLAGPGLGDGREIEDIKADLHELFATYDVGARHVDRARLVERLVLRAALLQLDQALRDLRPQLPELEQQDITLASRLRDALLGYAPWSPSPSGALGRRLYGYKLDANEGQRSVLNSRILGGDPHGLIAELGSVVSEALVGAPRVILALSATGRFYGSPGADVLGKVWAYVEDEDRNVAIRAASVDTRISGQGDRVKRRQAAIDLTRELWQKMLAAHLKAAVADPDLDGRRRVLLVTGSYFEAEAVSESLSRLAGPGVTVKRAVPTRGPEYSHEDALGRRELESFGTVPEPAVLVAPLSVVARGLNILKPGGNGESALSSIFVLTRPVPPAHSAEQMLRHVSYNARRTPASWNGAMETVEAEMRRSWQRVERLKRSHGAFSRMDPELRRELVCDVLVELVQLAGRGRRGRTPVTLYFVDAAFEDAAAAWSVLTRELLTWWRNEGVLEEMERYHGAFVHALAEYAGYRPQTEPEVSW